MWCVCPVWARAQVSVASSVVIDAAAAEKQQQRQRQQQQQQEEAEQQQQQQQKQQQQQQRARHWRRCDAGATCGAAAASCVIGAADRDAGCSAPVRFRQVESDLYCNE